MARSKILYKKTTEISGDQNKAGYNRDDYEDYWDEIYDDNELENRRAKFRQSTKAVKSITMDDK